MRRTNASLGHKRGVDPKVAADQRGHGLGVSMDVYTQADLEQKLAAVRALEVEGDSVVARAKRSNRSKGLGGLPVSY